MELDHVIDLRESHHWKTVKLLLQEIQDKVTNIDNLKTEGDLRGAQFLKEVISKLVRRVEGVTDAQDFMNTGR